MRKIYIALTASLALSAMVGLSSLSYARPPGPPPGGPGMFRPGPRPNFGRPPPPPRYHHHYGWNHFGRDVVGGALILGLGLGVANAIGNATAPSYTYVPPVSTYVPPNYYVQPAPSIVVTPPTTIVTPAPTVSAPAVSPSGTTMYWCQASKNFFPYVTECPGGWEPKIMP